MTDALVLGGGLAGSGAAILLARAGRSVSLIERETGPHHNVCGEFLSIEARDHLEALGMDPVALGGSPIDRVELASGPRLVEAPLPFTALGLSRYRLDEALLERAASAGVYVRRGIRVNSIEGERIRTSAGDVEGDTVLLATGKHRIRGERDEADGGEDPFVGFKMHFRLSPQARRALVGTIRLILFDGGYAGLQPVEDDRANLCLVIRKVRLGELGGSWDSVLSTLCALPHCGEWLRDAEPLMARPAAISNLPYGRMARPAADDRMFLLGDREGMTASLTGDGMALALRSAFVASRCVLQGGDVRDYTASYLHEVQGQIRRAMMLQHWQEYRLLRLGGVALLSACPAIVTRLAQATRLRRWA